MELLQRAVNARDPRMARAALDAALRASNDRLWVHRNVARIYREQFDDVASAQRVLSEIQPLTCSEWRLVAAAWIEVGDRPRASACLERAAANARTAVDLCTVAMGYREAGFADEGRLLLDGADGIVSRALDYWTVANAMDAYGDRDVAVATLERGLRDAVDVAEIVTFAHAMSTYDPAGDRISDTLARGQRRASTVENWLALALAYNQLVFDPTSATQCVRAASKLSISSDHERAIGVMRARVLEIDLLDDERPRLLPAQLLRQGARCFGWERDPAKLLGWIRARLLRSSIDALTQPDQFFANDDLITLLEIQKTGAVPHPLPAFLDGLRGVRWGQGAGADPLTRAFACTLLCLEDAAAATGGNEATMALLVETCIELGPGAVEGAIALFSATADAYEATFSTTRNAYLTLFAELALVLCAAWLDPSDPRIDAAIARLERDEPLYRDDRMPAASWPLGLDRWLRLGDPERWQRLAAKILVHPRQARLRERLGVGL